MMYERPCPFCGERPVENVADVLYGQKSYFIVHKDTCFFTQIGIKQQHIEHKTLYFWDRREE